MFIETSNLSQGIYVHIPYCIQKCHYCDFPTVLLNQGPDMDSYCDYLLKELSLGLLPKNIPLSSIYFGGGTPSLFGAHRIQRIVNEIKNLGYEFIENIEISFEINPGTLNQEDLESLLEAKVNRFSLGVQTFNNEVLKLIGREHASLDSHESLKLLNKYALNYSADLILGLPQMTLPEFKKDLETLSQYQPGHLSVYLLSVPDLHFLNEQAPKEGDLEDLLTQSYDLLSDFSFERYEISNFMHKTNGNPSRHNLLHWNDKNYWGVGLGAHSYFSHIGSWGTRFWNPRTYSSYFKQVESRLKSSLALPLPSLPQIEALQLHESMTDFCVTHLRQSQGLPTQSLKRKYPEFCVQHIVDKLQKLSKEGYTIYRDDFWKLSFKGQRFADRVFREICFLKNELECIDVR